MKRLVVQNKFSGKILALSKELNTPFDVFYAKTVIRANFKRTIYYEATKAHIITTDAQGNIIKEEQIW